MIKKYLKASTIRKKYMIIIMTIAFSLALINFDCKCDAEVDKNNSNIEIDETTEDVSDNRETKYDDFLLFVNNKDNCSLCLLNKRSKECKKLYDNVVSIMGSDSDVFKKLEKTNYFLANDNIFALDGDTFKITNIMEYDYREYIADKIFINIEGSIYVKNNENNKQKLLSSNMECAQIVHKDNIAYIETYDLSGDYYIYKYNSKTEEFDKIYDKKSSNEMAIDDNKNLYVLENSVITKYDLASGKILHLKEDNNGTLNNTDSTFVYLYNSLYMINKDNFKKIADKALISAASISKGVYLMTKDTNIIELDTNALDVADVLYFNDRCSNNYNNQNELIKIKDDNICFGNQMLTYSMYNGQENQDEASNYYYVENKECKASIDNPYIVKDKKTYLQSDINKIKESIKEQYDEYAFSDDLLAYTIKSNKHLVILDRKTNKKIYTSSYPVSNIQVLNNEVYYIRYINESGFYCYSNGINTLIDKNVVSDYAVTNENIYYLTIYNNELKCKNRKTNMDKKIEFLTTYKSNNNKGLKDVDEKVSYMVSDSDTLFFIIGDMLYKRKDHEVNKEFINILPWDSMSHLFLHENHIFTGFFGVMDIIRFNSYDFDYKKTSYIIYEDDKVLISPVKKDSADAVYVYDKEEKQIKDIIYKYNYNDSKSITKDAVYISCYDKVIYKIDLGTLDMEEFYKTNNYYSIFTLMKFYIIDERYCVIGDCNDAGEDELKGITILDIQNSGNRKTIRDVELLYAQGDYVYYKDKEDKLRAIDLSGEINANGIEICNNITDYKANYNDYIFFQTYNSLIMVDNQDNSLKVICDGNYHDIIDVSLRDNSNLVLIYLDSNYNIIKFDNEKSILGKGNNNSEVINGILLFTKENADGKEELYNYDINKDILSIVDIDLSLEYIFGYYIWNDKIVVKFLEPGKKIDTIFIPIED